jgi:hypothetical protein
MKRLKLSFLAVVALIIAAVTSSAFSYVENPDPNESELHWFRVSNGEYLGFELKSTMKSGVCSGTGNPCADGYSEIIGDPGEEEPDLPTFVEPIDKS